MNAYERERAECAADEEVRADQRLRAWRRRQIINQLADTNDDPLHASRRISQVHANQRLRASRRRHVMNRLAACNASLPA